MPKFDPVASLRIWAVETDVGGQTLRIPPLSAADWLPPLMRLDVLALLELVEGVDISELLIEDGISLEDVREALDRLVEAAAGRTMWAALALAYIAHEQWAMVGSDLARAGVRFEEISLGAALDAIYGSLIRSMDEKGIKSLNAALERPATESTASPLGIPAPRPVPANAEQYVRERSRSRLRTPPDHVRARSARPIPRPGRPADSGRPTRSAPRSAVVADPPAGSRAFGTESPPPPIQSPPPAG